MDSIGSGLGPFGALGAHGPFGGLILQKYEVRNSYINSVYFIGGLGPFGALGGQGPLGGPF